MQCFYRDGGSIFCATFVWVLDIDAEAFTQSLVAVDSLKFALYFLLFIHSFICISICLLFF